MTSTDMDLSMTDPQRNLLPMADTQAWPRAPYLPSDRPAGPEVLVRLCLSVGFSTLVALFVWLSGIPFWSAFVGCNVVGLAIFACIGIGVVLADSRHHAERKPWVYALGTLVGVCLGVYLQLRMGPESVMNSLIEDPSAMLRHLVSALVLSGIGVCLFYLREREQAVRIAFETDRRVAAERERQLVQAQLRALQAQIEPHFLFNTLANVRSLIDLSPPAAGDMLDHLNDYLRATLRRSRADTGTLADELEMLRAYLAIMQVRMGHRLRYRIQCPPELATHPLPIMLLQPLVENAIRHGLEPKVEGGEIMIDVSASGPTLQIRICDDGIGLPGGQAHAGMGISNIRERLQALFGGRAALWLGARSEGGVEARVSLLRQGAFGAAS